MISPRLFITAATIAISSSCHNSHRVVQLIAQQRKLPSTSLVLGFVPQRRHVLLPSRKEQANASNEETSPNLSTSVTGPVYELIGVPTVKLFTKQGCTLCDRVKEALESVRDVQPHSLLQVDITDDDKQEWFSRYKYDIPVLHINDIYWTKHRLSIEEAIAGIAEARTGDFSARSGEPNASRLERK